MAETQHHLGKDRCGVGGSAADGGVEDHVVELAPGGAAKHQQLWWNPEEEKGRSRKHHGFDSDPTERLRDSRGRSPRGLRAAEELGFSSAPGEGQLPRKEAVEDAEEVSWFQQVQKFLAERLRGTKR